MLKKCLSKLNFTKLYGHRNILSTSFHKYFSQKYSTGHIDIYPDEIIERLKTTKFTDETWTQFEADVLEKIHFFDRDQYVDLVILTSRADRGTELLWDQLARKIYDYELDMAQTVYLAQALRTNTKIPHYILDPIFRNVITAKIKWPMGSEVFKKFI